MTGAEITYGMTIIDAGQRSNYELMEATSKLETTGEQWRVFLGISQ